MYKLFFDGACKKNPGPGSYGFVIYTPSKDKITGYKKLEGTVTNNIAEYNGLLNGMKKALELGIKNIEIYGDSQLVIKQMKGEFKVKNKNLMIIYNNIKEYEKSFEKITYFQVERELNSVADSLANLAF